MVDKVVKAYEWWIAKLAYAQSPVLLIIRLLVGVGFAQAGWGKLSGDMDQVAGYFASLGIPAPTLNAYMAAVTELVGGIVLVLGIASRLTTIPLIVTMIVAFATAHREALGSLFSDPGTVMGEAPFPFLLGSLVVLLWGPGLFSLDGLIRFTKGEGDPSLGEDR